MQGINLMFWRGGATMGEVIGNSHDHTGNVLSRSWVSGHEISPVNYLRYRLYSILIIPRPSCIHQTSSEEDLLILNRHARSRDKYDWDKYW